jgi:hypothetical protein
VREFVLDQTCATSRAKNLSKPKPNTATQVHLTARKVNPSSTRNGVLYKEQNEYIHSKTASILDMVEIRLDHYFEYEGISI